MKAPLSYSVWGTLYYDVMINHPKQRIICFVGRIASGKGQVVDYFRDKHGATILSFTQILRDVLTRLELPASRDSFVRLTEALLGTFGSDLLSRAVAAEIGRTASPLIVVDAVRRLSDIQHLVDLLGFLLVEIKAEPDIRWRRLVARHDKPDDAGKTFEQFLADEQRSTELTIAEVAARADRQIDNNGSLTDLARQCDDLLDS